MAVELATAYVSIVPTTKGISGQLEKELSPLTGVAGKVGADSGKALGSSFTGASGGLKSSLGEAEGHFGNLKSKATGALDSIGISSGVLKVAGGAAIAGFALSAVNAFTETAKAALDLGAATGLSTEEASRWIGVADDFGVSAGELQSGLGKIAKTLDTGKWKQYGIQTRDAGGAARSTNDILLDSFDVLGKIGNETERARVGNDLFGKGYSNLAPLIGKSRTEMEKYLGAVEDGQVITDKEAAKAEKMRLAQDQLADALKDVSLAFGQMLAQLSPVLVGLAKFVELVGQIPESMGPGNQEMREAYGVLEKYDEEIKASGHSLGWWDEQVLGGKKSLSEAESELSKFTVTTTDSTDSTWGYSYALQDVQRSTKEATEAIRGSTNSVDGYSYAAKSAEETTARLAAAEEEAKRKTDFFITSLQTAREKVEALYGAERSGIDAKYAYEESTRLADVAVQNYVETLKKHKTGTEEADTATRDASTAILQASEDYATLNGASLNSELGTKRQIDALTLQASTLAPGSALRNNLDAYIADLKRLQFEVHTKVFLDISMGQVLTAAGDVIGVRAISGTFTAFAEGGPAAGTILAGEQGPELIQLPPGRSYVHTASETRALMSSPSLGNATSTPRLNIEHVEVHNDVDADGFFRYANFLLAGT